jgi:hypothetical protein
MKAFLLLVMLVVSVLACAPDVSQDACELGRSVACVCSSGAAGAQECGPFGAWSPCVCAAQVDAGSDVAVAVDVVAVDAVDAAEDRAGPDAADDATDVQTAPVDAPADVPRDLGIYDAPGVCLVPGMVPCGPDPADCVYLSGGRGLPARNCGACGVNCTSGQMCSEGRCVNPCATGRIYCVGNLDLAISCIDPMRNAAHCGGCGVACAAPMVCEGGRCVR